MPLADSIHAIGAVSAYLKSKLVSKTSASNVELGRPEEIPTSNSFQFNLFLYQIDIDGQLRNQPLDEGQAMPVWLVLHYLLTAFDTTRESETIAAHNLLGEGILALQTMNFIEPDLAALTDNPEPLKVTFDQADSELLSRIMQGSDEKYRLSTAFQVRPVMLVPAIEPRYSLPVKTVGQPGAEGATVLPSLGPKLETISPEKFAAGETLTLTGLDIGTDIEEVRLGTTGFPVTAARPGEIQALISPDTTLSAGSYPVTAILRLAGGRELSSNALLGHLLPELVTASPGALTVQGGKLYGNLNLSGKHLGGPDDTLFVAFYRHGKIRLMLEATGTAAQTALTVVVDEEHALAPGEYFIILRVNGEQATHAPLVNWVE